jgi:hypothetical protein
LEKLSEAIVKDESKRRLQNWQKADSIVLYDQNSCAVQDASTIYYLCQKFQKQGFKGHIFFLQGKLTALHFRMPRIRLTNVFL